MKRLTTLILTVMLILPVAAPAVAQTVERNSCPSDIPRAGYSDVDAGGTHAFDVDCIWWLTITDRQGTFGPTENLPRWEMATWIRNSLGWVQFYTIENPTTFTDTGALPADVADAIEFIGRIDITKGVGDGLYDPYGAVPRWQMALFLTRLVEAAGLALPDGADQGFVDVGGSTVEAQLAINQLAQLGITKGTGLDTFSPDDTVTREQMASFIARALEQIWVVFPAGICDDAQPATCNDEWSGAIPATPLRIRSAVIGFSSDADPAEFAEVVAILEGSSLTMEMYIDGIRQAATKSVLVRSGVAYAFWETSLPAGSMGSFEIEARFHIDGQLTFTQILQLTLSQ